MGAANTDKKSALTQIAQEWGIRTSRIRGEKRLLQVYWRGRSTRAMKRVVKMGTDIRSSSDV